MNDHDQKAIGQFRLMLNGIMGPLRLYGQGYYVDTAQEQIVQLALQMHRRLNGEDIPYQPDMDKVYWL